MVENGGDTQGRGAAEETTFDALIERMKRDISADENAQTRVAPSAVAALSALEQSGDWKSALQLALIDEARERPARAAALAALAGLILGALEGFEGTRPKS